MRRLADGIGGRGWHAVGIGLSLYVLTLLIYNVQEAGVLQNAVESDILVAIAAVALVAMCAGWWTKNSRMMSIGFLVTGFLVVTRSVFLITQDWSIIGVWLGFSVGIIAIGSYVKEGHALQQERLDDSRT